MGLAVLLFGSFRVHCFAEPFSRAVVLAQGKFPIKPPRMPSRRSGGPLNLAPASESLGARVKRLCPGGPAGTVADVEQPPVGATSVVASGSAVQTAAANIPARGDAPVVRNLRRGSVADATSSVLQRGPDALLDDLILPSSIRLHLAA